MIIFILNQSQNILSKILTIKISYKQSLILINSIVRFGYFTIRLDIILDKFDLYNFF